ncbi:MAG TPA: hypothetical protein VFI16_10470 [Anaeromyxobacteraceae bacterium]|nr:hypothetical protein [Anaeromyxobacteraceae bacterium]
MRRAAWVAAVLAGACIPERGPLMMPGEDCLECHGGGGRLPGQPLTVGDPEDARRWTVAGTVYPSTGAAASEGVEGAKVHIVDATGFSFTLETNRAGNFYTAERVRFPLRVSVQHGGNIEEMGEEVPYGGCNGCHRQPPRLLAPGRISVLYEGRPEGPLMMPGENCLECHGRTILPGEPPTIAEPRDAPPWTVAGTVYPSPGAGARDGVLGALVHIADAIGQTLTLETNLAGNFYTTAPVVFPLQVSVEYAGIIQDMEPGVPYGGCNSCHRQPPRQNAPGRISTSGGGGDG